MKQNQQQFNEDAMWKRWNSLHVVQGSSVIAIVKPSKNGGGPFVFGKVVGVGKAMFDVFIEKSSWAGFLAGSTIRVSKAHVQLLVKNGSHPILADEKDIQAQEALQGSIKTQLSLF